MSLGSSKVTDFTRHAISMVKLIVSVIDGSLSRTTVTDKVSDYPVLATSEDG